MPGSEEYAKIQKKIRLKKGFYIHFGIYVAVILFLFIMNFLTNNHHHVHRQDWWFLFPAASWGLAIAIHGLSVFIFSGHGILGDDWEAKEIEAELNKRGLSLDKKHFSHEATTELDIDQHLDLAELEKKSGYDEGDLV